MSGRIIEPHELDRERLQAIGGEIIDLLAAHCARDPLPPAAVLDVLARLSAFYTDAAASVMHAHDPSVPLRVARKTMIDIFWQAMGETLRERYAATDAARRRPN